MSGLEGDGDGASVEGNEGRIDKIGMLLFVSKNSRERGPRERSIRNNY